MVFPALRRLLQQDQRDYPATPGYLDGLSRRVRAVAVSAVDAVARLFSRIKNCFFPQPPREEPRVYAPLPRSQAAAEPEVERREVPRPQAAAAAHVQQVAQPVLAPQPPRPVPMQVAAEPIPGFERIVDALGNDRALDPQTIFAFCFEFQKIQMEGSIGQKQESLRLRSQVLERFNAQAEDVAFRRAAGEFLEMAVDTCSVQELYAHFLKRASLDYRKIIIEQFLWTTGGANSFQRDGIYLERTAEQHLQLRGVSFQERGREVFIAWDSIEALFQYAYGEAKNLKAVQKAFDILYRNQNGTPWHVVMCRTGWGTYQIRVHGEQISAKVIYSVQRLLIEAEKGLPATERRWTGRLFDDLFQDDNIQREGFTGISTALFGKIQEIVTKSSSFEEKLRGLLERILPGEPLEIIGGSYKMLSDLFQRSPDFPRSPDVQEDRRREAAFREEFKISRGYAEILHAQEVEFGSRVALPTGLQIKTRSDILMWFLESIFGPQILSLTAYNGDNKSFIINTRGFGQDHLSNCNESQLEQVIAVLTVIAEAMEKTNSRWRPSMAYGAGIGALCEGYGGLVSQYAAFQEEQLTAWARTLFRGVPSCIFSDRLRLSRSMAEVETGKSLYLRALLAECSHVNQDSRSVVWQAKQEVVPAETLRAKFYTSIPPQHLTGARVEVVRVKLGALIAFLKASVMYQQRLSTDSSFNQSLRNLEDKWAQAFEQARTQYEDSVYGVGYLENAFAFLEKTIYFLSESENQATESLEGRQAFEVIINRFLGDMKLEANPREGWQGCTQGLYTRMEKLFHSVAPPDPLLIYKTQLADAYWTEFIAPHFPHEQVVYKSLFERFLSREIGLGSDDPDTRYAEMIRPHANRAAEFIKTHLYSYDLFSLYYEHYLDLLKETRHQEAEPRFLTTCLELSWEELEANHLDQIEMTWNYYALEQELPRWICEFLFKKQILQVGGIQRVRARENVNDRWRQAERTGVYSQRGDAVPSLEQEREEERKMHDLITPQDERNKARAEKERIHTVRNLAMHAPWNRCLDL